MFGLNQDQPFDREKIKEERGRVIRLQKLLRSEVVSLKDFEDQLNRELVEVKDLEAHMQALLAKMETIYELFEKRNDMKEGVNAQAHLPEDKVDFAIYLAYVDGIDHIDKTLVPMMDRIYHELSRFDIKTIKNMNFHVDTNLKTMRQLESKANEIRKDIDHMRSYMVEAEEKLKISRDRLNKIYNERRLRKIGFYHRDKRS